MWRNSVKTVSEYNNTVSTNSKKSALKKSNSNLEKRKVFNRGGKQNLDFATKAEVRT